MVIQKSYGVHQRIERDLQTCVYSVVTHRVVIVNLSSTVYSNVIIMIQLALESRNTEYDQDREKDKKWETGEKRVILTNV